MSDEDGSEAENEASGYAEEDELTGTYNKAERRIR